MQSVRETEESRVTLRLGVKFPISGMEILLRHKFVGKDQDVHTKMAVRHPSGDVHWADE